MSKLVRPFAALNCSLDELSHDEVSCNLSMQSTTIAYQQYNSALANVLTCALEINTCVNDVTR